MSGRNPLRLAQPLTRKVSAAVIQNDLTPGPDKPNWPLSSYGPSKHEPNLIAGLDESPEELRTKYVAAVKAGNLNEYVSSQLIIIGLSDWIQSYL